MIDDIEATDAEIRETLKRLDKMACFGTTGDLFADAAQCIRWLQSGLAVAEVDCETKQNAVNVLTEGRGLPDDDLWRALIAERDKLKALNEDKFNTIQAYCKAASEDKTKIARLRQVLEAALRQSGCDGDLCLYQWHEDARQALAETER